MLWVLFAALFLPSVLTCQCNFPAKFTGQIRASAKSKDAIYNHNSDFKADLTQHRVYMTPRDNQSSEAYRVFNLQSSKVYMRYKNNSCSVHVATGLVFPDCVPSDFHKGGVVKETTQEFQKWYYTFSGRRFPAGHYIVKKPFDSECVPVSAIVVPSPRSSAYYIFDFHNIKKVMTVDSSTFDLSGCK